MPNPDQVLWCCHVRGPDDVLAAPDYETALRWADKLTERDRAAPRDENTPMLNAVPAVWPHNATSHALSLAHAMAEMGEAPAQAGAVS